MKGTRPLDNDEIHRVSTCFTGTYEMCNRGLFMLGHSFSLAGALYKHWEHGLGALL